MWTVSKLKHLWEVSNGLGDLSFFRLCLGPVLISSLFTLMLIQVSALRFLMLPKTHTLGLMTVIL